MKNTKTFKKVLALALTLVMVFGSFGAAGVYAATDDVKTNGTVSWKKVDSSLYPTESPINLAAEVEVEPEYKDTDIVRVSIVLEDPSTIGAGFATKDIAKNAKAIAYREKLEAKQQDMAAKISKKVLGGEELNVVYNITLIANIISAEVEYGKIAEIEAIPGVQEVFVEQTFYANTDTVGGDQPNMGPSSGMIGSPVAWAEGYTGAGSKVAIVDTGVDPDHQSFDEAGYNYAMEENAKAAGMTLEEYKASVGVLTRESVAEVWEQLNAQSFRSVTREGSYLSDKIPYAISYVNKSLVVDHDHDTAGEHGSHVTGISAANRYIPNGDGTFSPAMEVANTQGVAPDAQIVTMKVFSSSGASESNYMPAIEDAIILGCDSVNLSLGSSNAGRTFTSTYQKVMDEVEASGIVLVISAGNADSWAENTNAGYLYSDGVSLDMVGSPGSYQNTLCVASIDNDGFTGMPIYFGTYPAYYTETSGYSNPPISTTLPGDQEYVLFDSVAVDADNNNLLTEYADVIKGKIVLVYRGTSSFYLKMDAVAALGGVGCGIVNNQAGVISMDLSDAKSKIPCVALTQADGEGIKAASTYNAEGNYWTGKAVVTTSVSTDYYGNEYYTMSDFSSWGVPGTLELKPEITAPGGNIYSVNGLIVGGKGYENMSGTSMAAPQITGMVAVFGQYARANGLEEATGLSARQLAQSLLMSTAEPVIQKESKNYYSVLKQGAGLAQIGAAVNARTYLFMDDSACATASDGKIKVELGDDPQRTGKFTIKFSVNNMEDVEKYFNLRADFFTQDFFTKDDVEYLDELTTPLAASVKWTVDGEAVEPSSDPAIVHCDFDGDGDVDEDDGQALLDYVTTVRESIENEEYADFDGDENIDTYDVYLFFCMLGTSAVILPAGGSIDVTCDVTLKDISNYDVDGAYVEGYVFAEELTDEEGVLGDVHSIPVLGYYGSWTDPSMFDIGTYNDYKSGAETREPYMAAANTNAKTANNILIVRFNGSRTNSNFGGNPLVADSKYFPERDALSSTNSTTVYQFKYSVIRNAEKGICEIKEEGKDGYVGYSTSFNATSAAYYNDSSLAWNGTSTTRQPNYVLKNFTDNAKASVSVSLAPEYYTMNGQEVDFTKLGKGATKSIKFTVDNTAPELVDAVLNTSLVDGSQSIDLTFEDNQFVACVVATNAAKKQIAKIGAPQEAVEAGSAYTVSVPLTDETKLTVQVYDYAYNVGTYELDWTPSVPTEAPAEEAAVEAPEAAEVPAVEEVPEVIVETPEHVTGGLNAVKLVGGEAEINAAESAASATVSVTATDAEGNDVDTTNGLFEITWDPEALELTDYSVFAQYKSVKEEDGKLIVGYVDLEGIPAGEEIVKLSFKFKGHPAVVTVNHEEASEEDELGYTEVLCLFEHEFTEVRDAKEATCTEDGYTGDVYCLDCGELLEEGEVIPALGHDFDTENPEFVWNEDKTECKVVFTCENCGEEEEHDCEVVEEVVKEATETEPGLKKITATYVDEDGTVYTEVIEVVIPVKTSPETGLIISGIGVVGALGAAAYVFGRKRKEDEE